MFPVFTALAAKVHVKHKIRNLLVVGALTVLIDLDHFVGVTRATFHNVFVTLLLPIVIIILAFSFKKSYGLKGFSVLLLIFLSSHLFLDLFSEGTVALFYPLSDKYYNFSFNIEVPISGGYEGKLISTSGISILIYFVLVFLPCLFLDDIIEVMEKKHESFRKALGHPKK
jgi:membrane-bound metal-dependent hydrolase YbcI (DUF457 family)